MRILIRLVAGVVGLMLIVLMMGCLLSLVPDYAYGTALWIIGARAVASVCGVMAGCVLLAVAITPDSPEDR
jgi:xanthine/uracil/vitamin C permease (AzgA family)